MSCFDTLILISPCDFYDKGKKRDECRCSIRIPVEK
jgi:hypothetical protein